MRFCQVITIAAILGSLFLAGPSAAQHTSPPTPTTRILAIGTVNPGADSAAVKSILPTEVRETLKLYLDGKIDQWFSLQGRNGVAFILNVTDATCCARHARKITAWTSTSDELRAHSARAPQSASATAGDRRWRTALMLAAVTRHPLPAMS
jgi:hypothetical protein